jgi:predicted transcriptional regulator
MNIDDINRKNILTFIPRELQTLDDDILNSKVSDLTVKQLIVIMRLVKSNTRISKKSELINAEFEIYKFIKENPGCTNRQISNKIRCGFNIVKYYIGKMLDDKRIYGISIAPGSKLKGYHAAKLEEWVTDGTDVS